MAPVAAESSGFVRFCCDHSSSAPQLKRDSLGGSEEPHVRFTRDLLSRSLRNKFQVAEIWGEHLPKAGRHNSSLSGPNRRAGAEVWAHAEENRCLRYHASAKSGHGCMPQSSDHVAEYGSRRNSVDEAWRRALFGESHKGKSTSAGKPEGAALSALVRYAAA